nr:cutinase transcription factor 1 beta [Quercus suber]
MTSRGRAHRDSGGNGQPARRQPNACLKCHQKKVKCDMDSAGQRSPRKDTSAASSITSEPSSGTFPSNSDVLPTPPRSIPSDTIRTPIFNGEPFSLAPSYMETPQITSHDALAPLMSASPTANVVLPEISSSKDAIMAGAMPFFSGEYIGDYLGQLVLTPTEDDQQDYGYVLDMCGPAKSGVPTSQHYSIPQTSTSSMDHEDLAYAEAKGCFSIPPHQICEDLITAYFHFVHPMLPIIDQVSGTNRDKFSSDTTLSMTGCKNRQELKKVMYARAKCLHETGYEQDKVTLIQSSLLLGFWYADLLDRAKSWHWTGVAISMAQTIGLHRDPSSRHFNSPISSSRRRVWANIWWSCFFRDRWLSFGYGRPLRINTDDCDVPMPTSDCMLGLPEQCPPGWRRYAPPELSQAAAIWLKLLELTQVLGDVMLSYYQPRKSTFDATNIEVLERRILDAQPEKQNLAATSELLLFFEAYARLHVEVPLLVPAMTIHLLESKSNDPFTRSWSKNRLDLCLLVLKRLEDNYPAASLVHDLFTHAKDKDASPSGISPHSGLPKVDTPNPGNVMPWDGGSIDRQASVGSTSVSSNLPISTQTWPNPSSSASFTPDIWNTIFPEQLLFPLDDMHYWE